jgi:carboxyl-terminal processing protease
MSIGAASVKGLLSTFPQEMPERLRNVEVWRIVETRLRGSSGTPLELTFLDAESQTVPVNLRRRPDAGEPAKIGNLPTMFVRLESESRKTNGGATAAIIGFNVWMPSVDALFQRAIDHHRSADGIVVDLRGNPGGLAAMLMGISGHFLTERKALGTMKTRDTELRFFANPRLVNAAGERVTPFGGPLAILVDALTGSASECFAGGMQSIGRARVFGQTSMGQALPALFDKLPNGDTLIHAYGDFVTADGTRLEGRGVVPDEEVPLTRQDLLAGRDATLERALHWIDGGRGWKPESMVARP